MTTVPLLSARVARWKLPWYQLHLEELMEVVMAAIERAITFPIKGLNPWLFYSGRDKERKRV
jgi:hypothetical protein